MARQDFGAAETALRSQLLIAPQDSIALELSGDIASQRGDTQTSTSLYSEAILNAAAPSHGLSKKLAEEFMRAGRPFDAIDSLQKTIDRYPDDVQSMYDLAGLATSVGVPQLAIPILRWLAQHGQGDQDSLVLLAEPDRIEPDGEWCQKLVARLIVDSKIDYSLARLDAMEMKWAAVAKRLEPLVTQHQDFVPAFTLYGQSLIELNDFERLLSWSQRLPARVESSPEYWAVAGMWAQRQGRHEQAARAFWEGLRLEPTNHTESLTSLMLSLNQIGRRGDADIVAVQISRYGVMHDALKTHFERKSNSQRAAMRVAEAMLELGRIWEAEAWARLAASLPNEPLSDLRPRYLAIRSKLTADAPWQTQETMIGAQIDLSDLPQVDWAFIRPNKLASDSLGDGQFNFQDQATQRGWVHTCEIAPAAVQEGHWIYQTVGGGVGVIDFDLDGWPDLATAMLNGTPLKEDSSPNRLFRSVNGSFVDCSSQANYVDTGFSQGIAIGDFNEDGFPDIFDANIGRNRLYQNNGDGTFQDVSTQAGLSGNSWTTSVVIADINSDGIADLYETNYCRGSEPFERACHNSSGRITTCPPLQFEAENDRVWQGVGDGTFIDATSQWMDQTSPGRGLGVVIGSLDERPGLDLYIANDMTVNHLWSADQSAGQFRLAESGAIRGLGFDGRSMSQASMGMASGDPDGDGDIDFFLTHFSDDHNTYYEQISPGFWSDRSFVVGLAEPSMKLLGFGTQWSDFDNNGTLELVIANGHVDKLEQKDAAYRMPPQLFGREPSGHWIEQDRKKLGDYFEADHLGRAVALLDANRDGLIDVAITHLYDPVSLLINQTASSDFKIGLELKATKGSRDAIGARVSMMVGSRHVSVHLTAGDGYMCSNQRQLNVGTGPADKVNNMVVTWPSGTVQVIGTLESGKDYVLVEGSGDVFMHGSLDQ